jgi:hypothetical protein
VYLAATRWNSAEAAVDTVISRYAEVLQVLSSLSEAGVYDSETMTQAAGLRLTLCDFRVVLCMHVLKLVYRIIGPASRSLQGVAID